MLKQYTYRDLSPAERTNLVCRNLDPNHAIRETVQGIVNEVKTEGDAALFRLSEKFDGVSLTTLFLEKEELTALAGTIGNEQKKALTIAYQNIKKFHTAQLSVESKIETMPGVTCWREIRAVSSVGLYVPGGSAVLPSTFLMLGVPARLAGCKDIVVCSPPQKDGKINGYLAYCAKLLGIDRIYLAGGAQAIAAMAYGTASIPKTDKIFGPGNQYVTMAKTIVQAETRAAIDMPAGPSEVLIIADDTANPQYVAADLLAQVEHGPDSQAVLLSDSATLIHQTILELEQQLAVLPRNTIAAAALKNSFALLTDSIPQAMEFSNEYAPEHLLLQMRDAEQLCSEVMNAGSVFIGHQTPESAGDYASGTNHTLPTSGYAKSYSGVSVDSFLKKITFQQISREGIREIGPIVEILAELEGLQGHKNAITVRLNSNSNP